MSTTDSIPVLRERARALRRLAVSLDDCEASRLQRRAGADTWIGPVADECVGALGVMARRLRDAHLDVLVRAQQLDAEADAMHATVRVVRL